MLEAVRGGESRALVLRGEAGVGKTALLEHAIDRASGFRVARAAGVQSEMELAFAGLHQLCAPMLDQLGRLPDPQRDALGTAFGLTTGNAPDRFFVGLAVLGLFSEVAEDRPLLCVIDDAQWLDHASAQALAFVARRLGEESVGLVFGVRELSEEQAGLPELVVEGLREADARVLLASVISGPLDTRVRERIIAETRGNPLALLELPRGLTPAELAGGFALPVAMPLSGRIEERFWQRLEALPLETRRLLLVAAAEPVGDPVLVWRAAERLGVSAEAAAPAAVAGLMDLGAEVRFRHPLVRSAVYGAASVEERQAVHRALAEATDPAVDPDRRAWHLAEATPGPDEQVAEDLVSSAGRAQARGGLAAAAAFLERSVALTLDPPRRAQRALAAAEAKHLAGASDAALRLLALAEPGPLDEIARARVDGLRAQIAFVSRRGGDAPPLLLRAANRMEPLDPRLARDSYRAAIAAAFFAGRLARGAGLLEVAEAVREAPPASQPPSAPDLLLDGFALLITEGYRAGTPTLKRAIAAFCRDDLTQEEGLRWRWLACHGALDLWDDGSWDVLSAREVEFAREAGALTALPTALSSRFAVHVFAGEFGTAASVIEEMDMVTSAIGMRMAPYEPLVLAAWKGDEAEVMELIEAGGKDSLLLGDRMWLTSSQWSRAVLDNGLARYGEALAAAQAACEDRHELDVSIWALSELVEAACRTGEAKPGADALHRLVEATRVSRTDWGLGIAARSRALLSGKEVAEELYREAIDRLGRTRIRVELARAHLLYGEWLRREQRQLDAREQLRAAHEMFMEIGMGAFEQRAARELAATGATARKRTTQASDQLTPQEAQIARLASDGLTNPEIAARLFISRRTVEYHLHKVFIKLAISSRNQLHRALSRREGAVPRIDRPSAVQG